MKKMMKTAGFEKIFGWKKSDMEQRGDCFDEFEPRTGTMGDI